MKKNLVTKLLLISLLILVSVTSIACGTKDKQKVISNNVSKEAQEHENLIKNNIEAGNNYLKDGKYDLAKTSYEKAISLDIGNKQTYLPIKDKYLEKGRLDDAYYIIKLAVKNNADTANMNKILAEISGKLDTTNIKKYLQQNNKYTLPDEVTMKIDGVDKKTIVKWNKSSAIDTSKVGDFIYEGNSEQYGRKVKLLLYVTAPASTNEKPSTIKKPSTIEKSSTVEKPSQDLTENYNNIAKKTKNYILNGQGNVSDAEKIIWNTTLLNRVNFESLYKQYLSNGGVKDDLVNFARYITKNAPIQSDWKEVFEKDLYSKYGEKVVRYNSLGNDMYQAYIMLDGKEIPYVGVSSRTGRFHG